MWALFCLSVLVITEAWSKKLDLGNEMKDLLPENGCVFVIVTESDIQGKHI